MNYRIEQLYEYLESADKPDVRSVLKIMGIEWKAEAEPPFAEVECSPCIKRTADQDSSIADSLGYLMKCNESMEEKK